MPAALKLLTMTNLGSVLGRALKAVGAASEGSPRTASWLAALGGLAGWAGLDPEVIHNLGWGLIQLGGLLQTFSGVI